MPTKIGWDKRFTFDFDCEWLHLESLTLGVFTICRLPHLGSIGYSVGLLGFVFTGTVMYDTAPAEKLLETIHNIVNKNKKEVKVEGTEEIRNNDAVEHSGLPSSQTDVLPPPK